MSIRPLQKPQVSFGLSNADHEQSNVYRDGKRYDTVSYPVLAVSEAFNRGSPSTAQQLHRDDMAQHFDHLEGSGESSLLGLLVAGVVSKAIHSLGPLLNNC